MCTGHLAVSKLKFIHTHHPHFAFVKSAVIPSVQSGSYSVKLLLKKRKIREKVMVFTKLHANAQQD